MNLPALALAGLTLCGPRFAVGPERHLPAVRWHTGRASFYHEGSETASGEPFDPDGLTFAHRSFSFGTRVRFRWRGREVTARCTDRGPFVRGRDFDLNRGAARRLGFLEAGVVTLEWRRLP